MLYNWLFRTKKIEKSMVFRPATLVATLFLPPILLTLLALLPYDPQGPFDARDWQPARGVELRFPVSGALLEPFLAPGHALAGEPDVRIATAVTLLWLITVVAGGTLYRLARREKRLRLRHAGRALGNTAVAAGLFLVYLCFILLIPLPSWTLVTTDPDLVVADLQTHTVYSHDGLLTPRQNLALHRARGFDVVAFTEHNNPPGTLTSTAVSLGEEGFPYAVPGTEVREPGNAFVLAVGWVPPQRKWSDQWLHDLERQPVIALAWKLSVADVHRLAAMGITGFEIANAGHPDIPLSVRNAILEEARQRNLVLVASSDWHGWGGFWRTWTTFRIPGAARLSRQEKAEAVIEALRQRRHQDIQPVVAGYLGPPSLWQTLFAPFSALLRYGMELSPLRLVMWWVWGGLLLLLAGWLRKRGWDPVRVIGASLLGFLGVGLLFQGIRLVTLSLPGMAATETLSEVGGWGMVAGGLALLGGLFMARRAGSDPERKNQTSAP